MSSRPYVDDIFKFPPMGQGQWIQIYTGQETVQDPYEKNTVTTYNNPLPIVAIVTDLTAAQAGWKMPGIDVMKIKEVFVKCKYRSLIEQSQKICIEGDMYEGWKVNGKMQIREMAKDVIRLYVYIKVT